MKLTEFEKVKLRSAILRKWEELAGGPPDSIWATLAVAAILEEFEEWEDDRYATETEAEQKLRRLKNTRGL